MFAKQEQRKRLVREPYAVGSVTAGCAVTLGDVRIRRPRAAGLVS
ncbi:hypothetical protein ABZT28_20185 [Streptomyces sp. NPDC005388]